MPRGYFCLLTFNNSNNQQPTLYWNRTNSDTDQMEYLFYHNLYRYQLKLKGLEQANQYQWDKSMTSDAQSNSLGLEFPNQVTERLDLGWINL